MFTLFLSSIVCHAADEARDAPSVGLRTILLSVIPFWNKVFATELRVSKGFVMKFAPEIPRRSELIGNVCSPPVLVVNFPFNAQSQASFSFAILKPCASASLLTAASSSCLLSTVQGFVIGSLNILFCAAERSTESSSKKYAEAISFELNSAP